MAVADGAQNNITYAAPSAHVGATALTVSVWYRTNDAADGSQYMISDREASGATGQSFSLTRDVGFELTVSDGTNIQQWSDNPPISFSDDVWYHMTGTWDYNGGSPVFILYRDGSVVTSYFRTDTGDVTDLYDSGNALRFGGLGQSSNWNMDGQLAYAHVYTRALSAQEIEEIRYKPGSVTDSLVYYVPFYDDNTWADLMGNLGTATENGTVSSSNEGPPVYFPQEVSV
jgi:hypothetical protein